MSKTCMFGKADSAESSNDSINQPNPLPLTKSETQEINPFVCYRCSKRFPSLYALGGHQNAHKKERNEERKVFMERLLAMQKQSSSNSPTPLTIVPPVNVINSMPFHGPMVQVQPPQLMAGAGYERQKAPVLFVPDARYGPTRTTEVDKGGEGNQYCYRPYKKKPANKQSMALKLFAYEKKGFGGEAEEDSACSRYNYSASSAAATATASHTAACADHHQINTSEEELDLTLRL